MRSPAVILYDSSGNPISVVSNRVAVETKPLNGDYPQEVRIRDGDSNYLANVTSSGKLQVNVGNTLVGDGIVKASLLNGSSEDQAVNGSSTPVVFKWENDTTHDIEGCAIQFVVEDSTIYFGEKYAGIAILANGVLLEIKSMDTVYTFANFKTTREICRLACSGGFELFATTPDFLKAIYSISGLIFKKTGTYTTDDYIKMTVRDNLTGLNHQSALFLGKEID